MKIGIALCGGGAKGCYEQGAWQALRELGLTFDIVTGTSIGGFNGLMMVQDEFERCNALWDTISINNVMNNGFDLEKFNIKKFVTHDQFKVFLKHYVKQFRSDITPLKLLLHDYLKPDLIRKSNIIFGVNVTKFPSLKKEEVIINNLSDYDMYHYILASASAFPVFPICYINNKQYIDGGYSDNLPIDFAFKLGAKKVIAIDLNSNITHKNYANHLGVVYIYPKWDLGSFLYFDKDFKIRNKTLGYYDVYKKYGYYDGFKYIFIKQKKLRKLSNVITTNIIEDDTHFRNSNLKYFFKKTGYNDIFSYLNMHIYDKIKDYDYLLKTLEDLLEIFDYNPTEIYDIEVVIIDVMNKVKLLEYVDLKPTLNEFKAVSKKREYLNHCDKKQIIAMIYNKDYDYEFKMFIRSTNASLYSALIFIESIEMIK